MAASSGLRQPFCPRQKSGFGKGIEQGSIYNIHTEGALSPGLIIMITKEKISAMEFARINSK